MYTEKTRQEMLGIASGYDLNKLTILELATHSTLPVLAAAQKLGFKTRAVCEEGREELYTRYFPEVSDYLDVLKKFTDIAKPSFVRELVSENTVIVPNRGLTYYLSRKEYEERLKVPMACNRAILHYEDRDPTGYDQTAFMREAGLNVPPTYANPNDIDGPVYVKVQDARNPKERAFFIVDSPESYRSKAKDLIAKGIITKRLLKKAEIQKFIIGAYFNANFCFNPLAQYRPFMKVGDKWVKTTQQGRLSLIGYGDREQTNHHGLVNLPANIQLDLNVVRSLVEIGHRFKTLRESQIPKTFKAAQMLVDFAAEKNDPGFLGVFGLQGVFDEDMKFWVYDGAFRVPGDHASEVSLYQEWAGNDAKGAGGATMQMIKMADTREKFARIVT